MINISRSVALTYQNWGEGYQRGKQRVVSGEALRPLPFYGAVEQPLALIE